ncbi:MAG TPA: MiaB/RimO family radical SAM methylthiotransferase [Gemmatimonadales bacterium]
MKRVFIHTFGCKANQYDSEVVRQALEGAGVMVTDDPAVADGAVINTCTVTHVSETKLRSFVRRVARRGPRIKTVLMGCAAAVDRGALRALPGVVDVVPGADPRPVLAALGIGDAAVDPILRACTFGTRAWLKIQDGCDEHCTFCATRVARGGNRSRPVEEIVEEARALAERHAEIVLTGVHIGSYGIDRPPWSLGRLVEMLVGRVETVRFRLSSVEATEVCERLATLMRDAPRRLAPHVHAPLQSGSDRVLRRMGRHWYDAGTYRRRVEQLAAGLPVMGLGADVIVGFPDERAEDHEATVALLRALPFTYLHVFPYSPRPDAPARRLGAVVSPETVADRSRQLRTIAATLEVERRRARAGETADVVVLTQRGGYVEGLTEDYLTVYLPPATDLPKRAQAVLAVDELGRLRATIPGGAAA